MSWIEVESKIRVKGDVNEIRRRIKKIAKYVGNEEKIDDYYSLESGHYPKKSLRVRQKGKKVEVNFKQLGPYVHGIHAKKEVEFEVSDLGNFFGLLDDFGFRKWMRKEKDTELYRTKDGVNIELNRVKKLGWFVEIEILTNKGGVDGARKKIMKIREKLGLGRDKVQRYGYTKALWKLKHKKGRRRK